MNVSATGSIKSGELYTLTVLTSRQSANMTHLAPSEFGKVLRSLCASISTIARSIPKFQVRRINAPRMVAIWAIVQNPFSKRDGSLKKNPTCAMCADDGIAIARPNRAVAEHSAAPYPHPAGFAFPNKRQKPFVEIFGKPLQGKVERASIWLHNKVVLLCRASGCFNTAEAFSL